MRARVLNPINPRHGHSYAPGELVDVLSTYKHAVAGPTFATIRDLDGGRWIPCVRIEDLAMGAMEDDIEYGMKLEREATARWKAGVKQEKAEMFGNSSQDEANQAAFDKLKADEERRDTHKKTWAEKPKDIYAQVADNIKRDAIPHLEPGVKLALKPLLTLDTRDSNGYTPRRELIGSTWKHTNGKIYRVLGFLWDAESDRWVIEYKGDDDPVACTRSLHNFTASNERGEKRFTAVSR